MNFTLTFSINEEVRDEVATEVGAEVCVFVLLYNKQKPKLKLKQEREYNSPTF